MKSRSQEEASTGKSIVTTQTEPNPKPGNPQQEHPENQQASIGFQTGKNRLQVSRIFFQVDLTAFHAFY